MTLEETLHWGARCPRVGVVEAGFLADRLHERYQSLRGRAGTPSRLGRRWKGKWKRCWLYFRNKRFESYQSQRTSSATLMDEHDRLG